MEVGPHARMWVNNTELSPVGKKLAKEYFGITANTTRDLGERFVFSIMGRHLARAEEAYVVVKAVQQWLTEVEPTATPIPALKCPRKAKASPFTEAPRGSLLHYTSIKGRAKSTITRFCPPPCGTAAPATTWAIAVPWNRLSSGVAVPETGSPVNVGRLIRAFDP